LKMSKLFKQPSLTADKLGVIWQKSAN